MRAYTVTFVAALTVLTSFEVARAAENPGDTLTSGSAIHLQDGRGKYVAADLGGAGELTADRDAPGAWERFYPVVVDPFQAGPWKIALRTSGGKYVTALDDRERPLVANRDRVGPWETFTVTPIDATRFALTAWHGGVVSADRERGGALVANRTQVGEWETFTSERWAGDIFKRGVLDIGWESNSPYRLLAASGLCLDVAQASTAPGARLILWGCGTYLAGTEVRRHHHQLFHFADHTRTVTTPQGGRVQAVRDVVVKPRHADGLCLTQHGRDRPVTFETCASVGSDTRQLWYVHEFVAERAQKISGTDADAAKALVFVHDVQRLLGQQVTQYHQLRTHDGYCLDVLGGALVAGRELGVYDCKVFGQNQAFMVQRGL
jgi:hypothetical protein